MKQIQIEFLCKQYLMPHWPDFEFAGNIVYRFPYNYLLPGLCFERTDTASERYIWFFLMPLFVPMNHIWFNFGTRINGGRPWSFDRDNARHDMSRLREVVEKEASMLFDRLIAPIDFALSARDINEAACLHGDHLVSLEAMGYAFALAGDEVEATRWLDRIESVYAALQRPYDSMTEQVERARMVRSAVRRGHGAVIRLLTNWRNETVRALPIKFSQLNHDVE